jgi:hypothetical protein
MISFLLVDGANVHARALRENGLSHLIVERNTPLHLAAPSAYNPRIRDALQVSTALLDYSADIEAKEGGGKTTLLLAISTKLDNQYGDKPDNQVVNSFLKCGAKPRAIDKSGKDAAQRADEKDHTFGKAGQLLENLSLLHLLGPRVLAPKRLGRRDFDRSGFHA